MNPLKKVTAFAVLLLGIFAFSKVETKTEILPLDLSEINVIETISKQQLECRPSSDFMFYVEADLVKKVRGANTVNAKVFMLEKSTGRTSLLASENVQILKFDGAISIENNSSLRSKVLRNGDKILTNSNKSNFNLNELVQFETIYNSYIKSTNKLLDIERAI